MKAAKITVDGTEYFLVFDGEAMFSVRDLYGGTQLMLERLEPDTRDSFAEACTVAALLAERGELIRRRMGYDAGKIPDKEDFAFMARPFEIVRMKQAIIDAVQMGYGREVEAPNGDEVDLGLVELNQKKTH